MATQRTHALTNIAELLQDAQDTLSSDLENALECAHEMQAALAEGEYETVAEYLTTLIEHIEQAKTLVDLD